MELADNDPAVLRKKYTEEVKKNEEFQRKISAATQAQIERAKQEADAQYKQQIKALEKERDEMIEQYAGDPASIRQINQNFEAARESVPQPTPEESLNWMAQHPEFQTDAVFKAAAVQICEKHKDKPFAEQLAEADKELARRFPEYYGTPEPKSDPKPANGAPPANSRSIDGARTIQTRDVKSFDTLPAEAKAMFKTLEADGIKIKKEDFAKDFYNG